jgi:DNA-binding CsgD family transcriptional regulator
MARDQVEQIWLVLARARQGIVFLNRFWQIEWMTPLARKWLRTHFNQNEAEDTKLPRALFAWVRRLAAGDPPASGYPDLNLRALDTCLRIRWVSEPGGCSWLLLTEEDDTESHAALAGFGLTARETQILHWISEGKSNPEIALILQISPNTVRKHVQHILGKLAVESRSAAMRRILETKIPPFLPVLLRKAEELPGSVNQSRPFHRQPD